MDVTPQKARRIAAALTSWAHEREPDERTPETVLRAMLKAYEEAAIEAERAYWRAGDEDEAEAIKGRERAIYSVNVIRVDGYTRVGKL